MRSTSEPVNISFEIHLTPSIRPSQNLQLSRPPKVDLPEGADWVIGRGERDTSWRGRCNAPTLACITLSRIYSETGLKRLQDRPLGGIMNTQNRYWDVFSTIKRDAVYINRCHASVESIDRTISIFSAITSSTAIAGWAIWSQYSFVWGAIIAASQVLVAVKPFLPYKARLKALSSLGPDLDSLALTAETDWFKVSRGMLTEDDTYALAMTLKRKSQQAQNKHCKGLSLPESKRHLAFANREAETYMTGNIQETQHEAPALQGSDDNADAGRERLGSSNIGIAPANA